MVRSGPGWCPFAIQVEGLLSSCYSTQQHAKVGFTDHTAGGFFNTLKNVEFWNSQGYSVDFGLGLRGQTCQIVNLFDVAYGQGKDCDRLSISPSSRGITWPKWFDEGRQNPNLYMISTEHEDAETINGRLVFRPGSSWTEDMYQADLKLKRWCIQEYKTYQGVDLLKYGKDSLSGHHMFDPCSRAECPGRFWRDEYRDRLYTDLTGAEDVYVVSDALAPFFNDLRINGPQRINTAIDFGWPLGVKLGRIQMLLYSGYFEVRHGDGNLAQIIGWGNVNEGRAFNDIVEVVPDANGWISLMGTGHFNSARGLGYWK